MSTPANFNGQRPVIDANDAVMLLIDHQSGLFQTVADMPMTELRARAAALASIATLSKLPVITTASVPQGPNGPLIPEIHQNAPHAQYVARKGEINAWDNPDFVAAVKATGRKTLIIAGTITSVCMAFPSISAVAEGYKVFAVIDASGTYSKMAQGNHPGARGAGRRSADRHRRRGLRAAGQLEPRRRSAVGRGLHQNLPGLSAADRELPQGAGRGEKQRTAGLAALRSRALKNPGQGRGY